MYNRSERLKNIDYKASLRKLRPDRLWGLVARILLVGFDNQSFISSRYLQIDSRLLIINHHNDMVLILFRKSNFN